MSLLRQSRRFRDDGRMSAYRAIPDLPLDVCYAAKLAG